MWRLKHAEMDDDDDDGISLDQEMPYLYEH